METPTSTTCPLSEITVLVSASSFAHAPLESLPYSIRVLLESAVRNCDEYAVQTSDVERILGWVENQNKDVDIPFKPARVILQDFT